MQPPVTSKIPYSYQIHGQKIEDEYAWLRDPKWPEVNVKILTHLRKENRYYEHFFKSAAISRKAIFSELMGRIKLADQSFYVKEDNYYYYLRTKQKQQYNIYCRKVDSMDAKEEVLLDVNKLAKGKKFTELGAFSVSPDHRLLSYSVDFTGNERYVIYIYDLVNKKYLPEQLTSTIGDIVWHEKLPGFFYTVTNDNWRCDKVMFHKLGDDQQHDKIVFYEPDPLYNVLVAKSASKQFIFIEVSGHEANEIHIIDMNDVGESFLVNRLRPREQNIHYDIEHRGDYFYIKTNREAKNYKIAQVLTSDYLNYPWQDYVLEKQDEYLSSFTVSANYLILNYKHQGLPLIRVIDLNNQQAKIINFPKAEAFTASAEQTNFKEDEIRISYSSLARPKTLYQYDFSQDTLTVLKAQEIPSGFDQDQYTTERVWAENNGVNIPISLFYKKDLFKGDGTNPLYLYGYGAYGISIAPTFSNVAVSLANRGFVFAIAHIRGGDDLGQDWYESAKFLNKKLTFTDFIAVAEYLIAKNYTAKGNIVICGGSAGGLLIGNVINHRPELFKAAIAHVPFVDIINTMLDESLPLTTREFKEWGNPKDIVYFDYMKAYDPYYNIKAQPYPAILVTAGLSDPRVGYWEAAKWVARLRAKNTGNNQIICKTNLTSGHQGASGRFDYLQEVAADIAFIICVFQLTEKTLS